MSFRSLPADINRLLANLPTMTVGDIHSLCRSYPEFNTAVCRQNEDLKNILNQARESLTEYYDVIKTKTPTEIKTDLKSLQGRPNLFRLIEKGYEKAVRNRTDYNSHLFQKLSDRIVEYGQDHIMETLLEENPNWAGPILKAAVKFGREDLVRRFTTPQYDYAFGRDLIDDAIRYRQWDIVRYLLTLPRLRGVETQLIGYVGMLGVLDELKAISPKFDVGPLPQYNLYKSGSPREIIKFIKALHLNPQEALNAEVKQGRLDVIEALISEFNMQPRIPMISERAAEFGHLNVIEHYYNNLPMSDRLRILADAIRNGYEDIAKFIINRDPDVVGVDAFLAALVSDEPEIARLLVENMTPEMKQGILTGA